MTTHLSQQLLALVAKKELNLSSLATKAGISQGTLSHLISDGRRPEAKTLRGLCSTGPDRQGLLILIAHLRDEIDRAGRSQLEIEINADGIEADDDIALLESQSRHDVELKAIIHDLAELVRAVRRKLYRQTETHDDRMVAEDKG